MSSRTSGPTWFVSWGRIVLNVLLLPLFFFRNPAVRPGVTPLQDLREWFISFVVVAILVDFGVARLTLEPEEDPRSWLIAVLVIGSAIGGCGAVWFSRRSPIRTTDAEPVAVFRATTFIGIGTAMSTILMGTATTFWAGRLWPAALGLILGIPLLLASAPTEASIERTSRRLREAGIVADLRTALTTPSSGAHGSGVDGSE